MTRSTAWATAFFVSGCIQTLPDPIVIAPFQETRQVVDAASGTLTRRFGVLVLADGRMVLNGPDSAWWPNGLARWERGYSLDEPRGTWQSWFESGVPEAVLELGDGATLLLSSWWHSNGVLAARGCTIGGVREGAWKYWRADGSPASAGDYSNGLRDGFWQFYDEGGELEADGLYAEGARVGPWRLRDAAGEWIERAAEEVPPRAQDPQ